MKDQQNHSDHVTRHPVWRFHKSPMEQQAMREKVYQQSADEVRKSIIGQEVPKDFIYV